MDTNTYSQTHILLYGKLFHRKFNFNTFVLLSTGIRTEFLEELGALTLKHYFENDKMLRRDFLAKSKNVLWKRKIEIKNIGSAILQ